MPRPARHGPARWLRDGPTSVRPLRRRDGAFDVAGPVPHLATGRILVGALADGTAVAVPSVYAAHLEVGVEALRRASIVGQVRDLPWPLHGLTSALDGLPDHAPLPHAWLDTARTSGWRVAAPWQLDAGALGYGRWLPGDMVRGLERRDGGERHLPGTPNQALGALRWHGCHAEPAGERLDRVLLGWSAPLPGAPVVRAWSEDALPSWR